MKTYAELKALIETRGVHEVFGAWGEGWQIEQNPHELATFLVAMQTLSVQSVLEVGTGWRAGLARFLAYEMGWQVAAIDIDNHGHDFEGIRFLSADPAALGSVSADAAIATATVGLSPIDYEVLQRAGFKILAFHNVSGARDNEYVADYWRSIAYQDNALKAGYYEVIEDSLHHAGLGWIVLAELKPDSPAPIPQKAEAAPPKPKPVRKPRRAKKGAASS